MKEILWTNNVNLAEHVPMMNSKFTVNAITVPVDGEVALLLYRPSNLASVNGHVTAYKVKYSCVSSTP